MDKPTIEYKLTRLAHISKAAVTFTLPQHLAEERSQLQSELLAARVFVRETLDGRTSLRIVDEWTSTYSDAYDQGS